MSTERPVTPAMLAYKKWFDLQVATGRPLQAYATPCCGLVLHTPYPAPGERQWDSLHTCPSCVTMHMKIVHADRRVQLLSLEDL